MKTLIKRSLIAIGKRYGKFIPTTTGRRFFYDRVFQHLSDPKLLPQGLVERPTKRFGIDVLCDPYTYVHRSGYWCGVFYEEELENYLLRELRPGDTVLDVGMNVGHVALPAASLVGKQGVVIAFEPNTDLVTAVQRLAEKQGLTQIEFMACGIGNVDGSCELKMDSNHSGGATFRALTDESLSHSMKCAIRVGDDVLRDRQLPGRIFLKMDVEGFEVQALEGLKDTLPKVAHAIIEISPAWLGIDGVKRLFEIMSRNDLLAHQLNDDGSIGGRISPAEITCQMNVLFRRPRV